MTTNPESDWGLSLELLRVVEQAAIASAQTMGQGDRHGSDQAAVASMRRTLDDAPIPAPIAEGQQVATLEIDAGEGRMLSFPLQAGAAVERLGLFGRAVASIKYMIFGPQTQ